MIFLDSFEEDIQEEIDHYKERIARGIAYDFDKMKRIWECKIEILTKLLKAFKEIKKDVNVATSEGVKK